MNTQEARQPILKLDTIHMVIPFVWVVAAIIGFVLLAYWPKLFADPARAQAGAPSGPAAPLVHVGSNPSATPVVGGDSKNQPSDLTPAELKARYLWCDRAVMDDRLPAAGIMHCSVVYEELKWRVFDGDLEKLLAWSRSHPSVPGADDGSTGRELTAR